METINQTKIKILRSYTHLNDLAERNTPKKRLYTLTELPTEFGATEWFWRTQIWRKNIPVIRISRTQYLDSNDLEIFLEKYKYRN